MLDKIILYIVMMFFAFSSYAHSDESDAKEFVKGLNSKRTADIQLDQVYEIVDIAESKKEEAKNIYQKDIMNIMGDLRKVNNSQEFKEYQDWARLNNKKSFQAQSQTLPTIDYNIIQNSDGKDSIGDILRNYRLNSDEHKDSRIVNYPMMIFVSSSMPKASLSKLMEDSRIYGGVIIFRGVIGSLKNTQLFLSNINKENVSAIIDPRLFDLFNIKLAPTFVVLKNDTQDCQSGECNFTPVHDRVTGNITMKYALELISDGEGEAKDLARNLLENSKNKSQL